MGALAFGVVCAVAFTAALFVGFRRPQENEPDSFSHKNVFITEPEHLRESVRLAELLIKEISEATATLEKKAVLLITLCAALLAYLGARDIAYAPYEAIRGAAFLALIISALIAAKAMDLRRQSVAGLHLAMCEYYAKEAKPDEALPLSLRYALDKYRFIINEAEAMHREKSKMFNKAKSCLIVGIALTLAWTAAWVVIGMDGCRDARQQHCKISAPLAESKQTTPSIPRYSESVSWG